jgi:hypothetical protein
MTPERLIDAIAATFGNEGFDTTSMADVNPVIEKLMLRHAWLEAIEEIINGINIEEHRRRFGDELVDRIIATSEQTAGLRTQRPDGVACTPSARLDRDTSDGGASRRGLGQRSESARPGHAGRERTQDEVLRLDGAAA